ncbi:MAG: hypothetical protein K9M13_02835, partial [Simkaniaceae bacterium]|nr:hypothetical protein [Simkaniaceae bacterium]
SINLITAHDGFTLKDLVSYSHKHNEINGEKNRDGNNCNFSINFGFEGEKQSLNAIRKQQVKNFFLFLFCSIGTPLIVMGDEIGISHRGNNNPWCQDSTLNWLHWDKMDKDLLFYCIELIKLRKNLPHFDIQSYDDLNRFEWLDQPDHQVLCLKINAPEVAPICIVINPTSHQIALSLPPGKWKQMFANFYYSPHHLIPHSSVILEQVND